MKLSDMSGDALRAAGALDALFSEAFDTPFGKTLQNIREADADEAQDKADAAYRLMWSTSEQLAETVKKLRELGHKDLREMRVLSILNDAILALEAEGFGV